MEQKTRLGGRGAARISSRGPALEMQEYGKSLHPDFSWHRLCWSTAKPGILIKNPLRGVTGLPRQATPTDAGSPAMGGKQRCCNRTYRVLLSALLRIVSAAARLHPMRRSFTLCKAKAPSVPRGAVTAKKSARSTSFR
jgi:hypothetical protein